MLTLPTAVIQAPGIQPLYLIILPSDVNNVLSSRVFSLSLGLFFAGMALGPTVGGLFIRYNHNVMSVFYLTAFIHCIFVMLVWLVIPESLSHSQRAVAQRKYSESVPDVQGSITGNLKKGLAFLSPLTVLLPHGETGNQLKCWERDWSLSLSAAAYGFTIMVMVILTWS
jgi:MFS family permease